MRIVIAGAGAVGASIAYHLALLRADDVVLALHRLEIRLLVSSESANGMRPWTRRVQDGVAAGDIPHLVGVHPEPLPVGRVPLKRHASGE